MIRMDELLSYAGILPGIGAALLSAYNWYQMHRGAVLKPQEPVSYGLRLPTNEERFDRAKTFFYFPLVIQNTGTKPGTVTKIDIIFTAKEGKKRMKKVGQVHIPQEAFLAVLQTEE